MAQGKKSFIAYSDWYGTFKALPDDIAGQLIKYIFSYVNDENPQPHENFVINALFEQVKATLKRDLDKWDKQREQRSKAGKKSAKLRATKINDRSTTVNEKERNSTVNVNVNVNDNVNDNVTVNDNVINNNTLMSEIKISDLEDNQVLYFEIAKAFQELFIKNLKEKNAPSKTQEKATYKNYVTPIRLMFQKDEVTKEQLTKVFKYLDSPHGEFWKSNILSTKKLREKFSQLLIKSNTSNGKQANKTVQYSQDFKREIFKKLQS